MPTHKSLSKNRAMTERLAANAKRLAANANFERGLWKREQQCEALASALGANIDSVRDLVRRGTYVKEYVTRSPFISEAHAKDAMAEFAMHERDHNPPSLATIRQWADEFGHSPKKNGKGA